MASASIHRSLLLRPIATLRRFSNRPASSLKLRTSCASETQTISFSSAASFTWDDVHRVSQPEYASEDDSSDLTGFFQKVRHCNRGMEFRVEFLPFVVEDQVVGYVHDGFAVHLKKFPDVFTFCEDKVNGNYHGGHVSFHPSMRSPEDRTRAVGHVIKILGEDVIPGIRNELYPVASSFGKPVYFSLERAAAPYFGIKAYGVHMNGFVEQDGQKYLWIGKRSLTKPTYPGMLDHLVAGGLVMLIVVNHPLNKCMLAFSADSPATYFQEFARSHSKPHGIACYDNVLKECEEEAGIPPSLAKGTVPVGAVSYMDINGHRFKRDVLFCYDLKLPEDFIPINQDGEVVSFKLIPVMHAANIIRRTEFFKANCSLVIIDFLFRHGYIKPENAGYLDLLQSLRNVDCS